MNRRILHEIGLLAGPPGGAPLRFTPTALTVFVGPNNSGKSLVLRDIENYTRFRGEARILLLDYIAVEQPTEAEAAEFIAARNLVGQDQPTFGCIMPDGNLPINFKYDDTMARNMAHADPRDRGLIQMLAGTSLVRLDGQTRLTLVEPRRVADLHARPSSHLHALFVDDAVRGSLRTLVKEAFDFYPVIDPTHIGHLRLRISQRPPRDSAEERNWDARAMDFHRQARLMSEMSDGVKSYTGLVMTLLVGFNYRVVLIDEPEAFLHPPLARRLGRSIAKLSTEQHMNTFASTHSSDFLFGAVRSGADVQVVRLTYSISEGATARVLPANILQEWMQDPMLRSTGVLAALFHKSVVISEGDSDRPFYQEINERLSAIGRGATDTLFLSGYGKQNVKRLLRPLREIGIPAAAVVDLDIIKGNDLTELMRAAQTPEPIIAAIGALKARVLEAFRAIDARYPTGRIGLDQLPASERDAGDHLLRDCAEYGVFIVPGGTVESWLSRFNIAGYSFEWLSAMFRRLGSAPTAADYIVPEGNDVWVFLDRIARWLNNPARRGVQ